MKLTFIEKRHGWILEQHKSVTYKYPADGLVIVFKTVDIETILNKHYEHNNKVWWFNDTHDREIAERRGDVIVCNPQVLWRHKDEFPPVIGETVKRVTV